MVVHVLISGFVQGVGFRQFMRHHALKLGLTGWTKNLPDNRVESIFQGSKEQIDQMIFICRKGPFLSEVNDVVAEWKDKSTENFKTFEVLH